MLLAIDALHEVSGGAERVLTDVANGLHRRGFPVTVMTYQAENGPSFFPLDFGIRRLDGRVRPPIGAARGATGAGVQSAARRRPLIGVALWLFRYGPRVYRYRRLLRVARPDVAIGFLPSTFPYLTIAASGTSVRTVASLHNVPDRDMGDDPVRWDQNPVDIAIRRRTLRFADAVTVLLPSFVSQLDDCVRRRTYVVPNMIRRCEGASADVRNGADNVILAVGRFSPAKDHATLLRAWATIESNHPSWRLKIIGDGPLHTDLTELSRQLGLRRASIHGPTRAIEEAYTSSKFLVMPSIHEGFGLVTAEAMACGLPVIGFSDCEGTNEIVVDEMNGLLVEPGRDRVGALADAMQRLIEDEGLRLMLAEAAPQTVRKFEPDAVLDEWVRLILDVHRGRVGRRRPSDHD